MDNSKITFITNQQNAALRTCCVLQEEDVCVAILQFTFIPKYKLTKGDGTKVTVGKIVADLYDLLISDSAKNKETIVQRFMQALQTWEDDKNVVSDIEVYLNHKVRYEDVIANEGFDKVLYKDACKHYQNEEADKTCYLTKHKSLPANLKDSLFVSFYEET